MKWNHLPERGGLYQQNPEILDRFYYIFAEKAKAEAAEAKRRESGQGKGGLSSRSPTGRRRR
jgi:hypothetical protein